MNSFQRQFFMRDEETDGRRSPSSHDEQVHFPSPPAGRAVVNNRSYSNTTPNGENKRQSDSKTNKRPPTSDLGRDEGFLSLSPPNVEPAPIDPNLVSISTGPIEPPPILAQIASSLFLDSKSENSCPLGTLSFGARALSVPEPLWLSKNVSERRASYSAESLEPYKEEEDSSSDCTNEGFGDEVVSKKCTEVRWQAQFDRLKEFQAEYGHCSVPFDTNGSLKTLTHWIKRQRQHYKLFRDGSQTTMTRVHISRLESIGFVWNSHDAAWESKFQELLQFKREHGDCNVPRIYPSNPPLSIWVKRQRRRRTQWFPRAIARQLAVRV